MTIWEMVPSRRRRQYPIRHGEGAGMFPLQREMNRLFDEFLNGFDLAPLGEAPGRISTFSPSVDVQETDKDVKVSAELPGIDEKDIEVSLDDNVLTLKGEKKEEHEEKDKTSYRVERSYGSFHRSILLPPEIDAENVKAKFKKGVLTVTLPKLKTEPEKRKKIDISAE